MLTTTATQLTVIALALLPIGTAMVLCAGQRRRLGLFHLYAIAVALYYGVYTIVDALSNPDMRVDANIERETDVLIAAVLMISVSASLLLLNVLHRSMPTRLRDRLTIAYLVEQVMRTPFKAIFLLWLVVIAWTAYIYFQYGIISHHDNAKLRALGLTHVPSWVGPMATLFHAIGFSVFIVFVALVLKRRPPVLLTLIIAVATVALLAAFGRRNMMSMVLLIGVMWVVVTARSASLLTFKNMMLGVMAVIFLVLFSNVYQLARSTVLLNDVPTAGYESTTRFSFLEALTNFQRTRDNLRSRTALWRFHYWILDEQMKDPTNIMAGSLLIGSVKSAVPRALNPNKGDAIKEDREICFFYQSMCNFNVMYAADPSVDYPQTIISVLQADFGYISIFMSAVLFLVVLYIAAFAHSIYGNSTFGNLYFIIIYGVSAWFIINVEQSLTDFFIYLRNIIIIFVALEMIRMLSSMGSRVRHPV